MGIRYYSNPDRRFTDLYIALRQKEDRLYTEAQIRQLPEISANHPHFSEWKRRKKSTARFLSYLNNKNMPLRILDVGCGNGWFSHAMSAIPQTTVLGIDVNIVELEQAESAFSKTNLAFACADLFEETDLRNLQFDIIVFNSCLQYFENLPELFRKIRPLLSETAEIHVIDSPFYAESDIEKARIRTKDYYNNLGFPQMASHYFHHTFESLGKYEIFYKPSFITRHFTNDSPFCWIKTDPN